MDDDEILALVAFGASDDDGVERAAEPMVEPVELEARGAAAGKAVAAEQSSFTPSKIQAWRLSRAAGVWR